MTVSSEEDSFASDEQLPTPTQENISSSATQDMPMQPQPSSPPASSSRVQAALITAQVCFGLGGVISALGLPACNPFAFALYREVAAGALLLLAARHSSSTNTTTMFTFNSSGSNTKGALSTPPPMLREWKRFALLGLALFGNQAGVIAGIKLAGPVAAAVWQPSQPIITAAICMMLGWEATNVRRIGGVILSFVGCAAMVILSTKGDDSQANKGTGDSDDYDASSSSYRLMATLVGHVLFFFNCLCTSLYVLLSKKVLKVYRPIQVTAWSYNIAAIFMVILAYLSSLSDAAMTFLCPDCQGTWIIPTGAVWALAYAIVFNSVIAYGLITWANQFATGTLVIGYSVLQPVTAALLTLLLLGIGVFPNCSASGGDATRCLDPPGWGSVMGMVGVFSGLALVISTEPKKEDYKYDKIKGGDEDTAFVDFEMT